MDLILISRKARGSPWVFSAPVLVGHELYLRGVQPGILIGEVDVRAVTREAAREDYGIQPPTTKYQFPKEIL